MLRHNLHLIAHLRHHFLVALRLANLRYINFINNNNNNSHTQSSNACAKGNQLWASYVYDSEVYSTKGQKLSTNHKKMYRQEGQEIGRNINDASKTNPITHSLLPTHTNTVSSFCLTGSLVQRHSGLRRSQTVNLRELTWQYFLQPDAIPVIQPTTSKH